jgi:hypothetical protein
LVSVSGETTAIVAEIPCSDRKASDGAGPSPKQEIGKSFLPQFLSFADISCKKDESFVGKNGSYKDTTNYEAEQKMIMSAFFGFGTVLKQASVIFISGGKTTHYRADNNACPF